MTPCSLCSLCSPCSLSRAVCPCPKPCEPHPSAGGGTAESSNASTGSPAVEARDIVFSTELPPAPGPGGFIIPHQTMPPSLPAWIILAGLYEPWGTTTYPTKHLLAWLVDIRCYRRVAAGLICPRSRAWRTVQDSSEILLAATACPGAVRESHHLHISLS